MLSDLTEIGVRSGARPMDGGKIHRRFMLFFQASREKASATLSLAILWRAFDRGIATGGQIRYSICVFCITKCGAGMEFVFPIACTCDTWFRRLDPGDLEMI
jgi:hypothetical protein